MRYVLGIESKLDDNFPYVRIEPLIQPPMTLRIIIREHPLNLLVLGPVTEQGLVRKIKKSKKSQIVVLFLELGLHPL